VSIYPSQFYGHGKLLLSGEYFVLDGALAISLPTRLGQSMSVQTELEDQSHIRWTSLDDLGQIWFEGTFDLKGAPLATSDEQISNRLSTILSHAILLNPAFLVPGYRYSVVSRLEFPRDWGLGSSSTLLYTISKWAGVDPHELLEKSFGGSGYDIATAGATGPIFYRRAPHPDFGSIPFHPAFINNLYFVYLGRKQNSREGIARYRAQGEPKDFLIDRISQLSKGLLTAPSLEDFNRLLFEHERTVADYLDLQRSKDLYFTDFWGEVKSLGAWGGDFVLVTSDRPEHLTRSYFNEKGFGVLKTYKELILS
jgi:mevalonate kinase